MFKVGDIVKIKDDKRGLYVRDMVNQSHIVIEINDSNVLVGEKLVTVQGLVTNDYRTLSLMINMFELDLIMTRKQKIKKICSKLEIL